MDLWEAKPGLNKNQAILEAKRCLSCKNPKCQSGCPTSMRIKDFILEIKNDNLEKAYDIINDCSNLPYVCSIVCPHEQQCMGHCILSNKDKPINIGGLERYVVENINKKLEIINNSSLKVLVIGGGPAGFSFAKEMAKNGCKVDIFEATSYIGGILALGIPNYRLDKSVLDRMGDELKQLNVNIYFNRSVKESEIINLKEKYDIIYISIGLTDCKKIGVPNEDVIGVYDALTYLKDVNLYTKFNQGKMPVLKGKTIVIGAGNVAMDASRTAVRQGSKTTIVYRRSKDLAPATKQELAAAESEGVEFKFLYSPVEIIGTDHVTGLKVQKMILGPADSSGRSRPIGTEEYEIIECDNIISAIGQNPLNIFDAKMIKTEYNYIVCENFKTNIDKIYAGGDIVLGAKTVVEAQASAKEAAKQILKNN